MISMDKAIKNLTAGREDCGMIPENEYTPTIDLATEALKRVKACRHEYGCPLVDDPEGPPEDILAAQLLPGEIPF